MKKIVVTGSSGRIGSAIAQVLSKEFQVTGIDIAEGRHTTLIADILDKTRLSKAFEGCEAVIHAAAFHAPHVGRVKDEEFMRVNVEGTKTVAILTKTHGLRKIIFTSTTALYGYASQAEEKASWIDEKTKPEPKTIYHRSKLECEEFLKGFAKENYIPVVSIRMSRCFPEPANLMAVYRLHRGIDKRDVARAHQLALESHHQNLFETFIISGETPFKQEDCRGLFHDACSIIKIRSPGLWNLLAERGFEIPGSVDRVYCSDKARKHLNWRPEYGFKEVIHQLDQNSREVLDPVCSWNQKCF